MSLITPDYMALQKELHARSDRYGASSDTWADTVRNILAEYGCESVLDYGCGKGLLRKNLGEIVREYDPCIEGKDDDPEPADLVVCTDVLEHIEPDCLRDVLHHLRSKTKKRLFFVVSLQPARKSLKDGRNAHLIVESADWWKERLAPFFKINSWRATDDGKEVCGVAQPIAVVGQIKAVGAIDNDTRNAYTLANVGKTFKRIPEQPVPPHDGVVILACYGPSLKESVQVIARHKKKTKGVIVSVSGAHDFLRAKGIIPDYHVECDPRPHKAGMLLRPHDKTQYYMASCCHPDLISRMANYDLTLWHLFNGAESFKIRDIPSEQFATLIPGGGAVGLRAITLFYFLGYRQFVIHGMDCSFGDEGQHAGPHTGKRQDEISVQPKVDLPEGVTIRSDRWFKTSPVLISYANHLRKDLREGRYAGAEFVFVGNGLLPELIRLDRMEVEALIRAGKIVQGPEKVRDYFHLEEGDFRPEEAENLKPQENAA